MNDNSNRPWFPLWWSRASRYPCFLMALSFYLLHVSSCPLVSVIDLHILLCRYRSSGLFFLCAPVHFHIHTTSPPNGLRSLFVVLDFVSTLLRFTGLTSWLEILYLYVMSFSQCLFICYVLLYGCLLYDCMWILVWFVPVQNIVPTFNQEKFYNNLLTCMIIIKLKPRTRYFPTICFNNLKESIQCIWDLSHIVYKCRTIRQNGLWNQQKV